jgi:hypothetical protein
VVWMIAAGVIGVAALLIAMHVMVDGFNLLSIVATAGEFLWEFLAQNLWDILVGVGFGATGLVILAIVAVLAFVVILGERDAGEDAESVLSEFSLLIRAGAVVLFLGTLGLYLGVDGAISFAMTYWWLLPLIGIGYLAYVYLSHRRDVASSSTAIDRTQRTVQRNVSSRTEAAAGAVVLAISFVAAAVSGVFAGLNGLGDVILMFAGELGYLFAVLIGYAQLGGEVPLVGWAIPALGPRQWLAITLFLGAAIIMVSQER